VVPEHAQRKGHRTLGFVFARGAPVSLTEIARISTNLAMTACGVSCIAPTHPRLETGPPGE
jgi:hypothetical protein